MTVTFNRRDFIRGLAVAAGAGVAVESMCPVTAYAQELAKDAKIPLRLINENTKEAYNIDLFVGPDWNAQALLVCDYLMRDWRQNQWVQCDRKVYAALYVVQRLVTTAESIHVHSGFRTRQTNDLLREEGYNSAVNSQHLLAKAVDFHVPGVDTRYLARVIASLNVGGVGCYADGQNFCHMDVRGSPARWGSSF